MLEDIRNEKDVATVVDHFYEKVNKDPEIGPFFGHVNWDTHLPRMYAFWNGIVFQQGGFTGNPFAKHAAIPHLETQDFDRWLQLFTATVDEYFQGDKAQYMKEAARQIATVFQIKLGLKERKM